MRVLPFRCRAKAGQGRPSSAYHASRTWKDFTAVGEGLTICLGAILRIKTMNEHGADNKAMVTSYVDSLPMY